MSALTRFFLFYFKLYILEIETGFRFLAKKRKNWLLPRLYRLTLMDYDRQWKGNNKKELCCILSGDIKFSAFLWNPQENSALPANTCQIVTTKAMLTQFSYLFQIIFRKYSSNVKHERATNRSEDTKIFDEIRVHVTVTLSLVDFVTACEWCQIISWLW